MTTSRQERRQKLTTKFCNNVTKAGEYLDFGGPVPGLILVVNPGGKSKSWLLRYRFRRRRREMGQGSYPEVGLADARAKGGEARRLLAHKIDPLEHHKQQEEKRWLAAAKNRNFLAVAEDFIRGKISGDNPYWGSKDTRGKNEQILKNRLTALHKLPIDSIEAAETITLRLYNDIVGPIWLSKPFMAKDIKDLAKAICEHAYGMKVLPANVANPAGGPLDFLLRVRQPKGGKRQAIPYQKTPALYAKLDELSKPAHSYFTIKEAARATGEHPNIINNDIRNGDLPATKGECRFKNMIGWEWRIEPADLFARRKKVLDVIPGVRPVAMHLVKYAILNGCRPSEAREMTWSEYDPIEQLWILPWQRLKEGDEIRQDLVIPLSQTATNILEFLKAHQIREEIKTNYVFANYPSRFSKWAAKIGDPVCPATMLNNLRKALPPEEFKATMHGMRTAFRSWGDEQNNPDGTPRFAEKDLERAIGHAAGFGSTEVSRIYSRQSKRTRALVPIFDGWARFVTSGGEPAEVIPFRRSSTGGL
jgi:integrase